MATIPKHARYARQADFDEQLVGGLIDGGTICFIEDTRQIYFNGNYYTVDDAEIEEKVSAALGDYYTKDEVAKLIGDLDQDVKDVVSDVSGLKDEVAGKADAFEVGYGLTLEDSVLKVTIDPSLFVVCPDGLPSEPAEGEEDKIHLVQMEETEEGNAYEEWLWVNGAWELFGTLHTKVDLSNYLPLTGGTLTGELTVKNTIDCQGNLLVGANMTVDDEVKLKSDLDVEGATSLNLAENADAPNVVVADNAGTLYKVPKSEIGGGDYLPLTGGELTGDLDIGGRLTVDKQTELAGTVIMSNLPSGMPSEPHVVMAEASGEVSSIALEDFRGNLGFLPLTGGTLTGGLTVKGKTTLSLAENDNAPNAIVADEGGGLYSMPVSALSGGTKQGVFIAYDDEDGNPRICEPRDWYKMEGIADAQGIALIAGGLELLIAPEIYDTAVICEDYNFGDHGVLATSVEGYAVHDYDGRENTATLSEAESSSVYRYVNEYTHGHVAAGKWWVPSLGELNVIAMFEDEINDAYDQLTGNMVLIRNSTTYVSSTLGPIDDGERGVWCVRFNSNFIPSPMRASADSSANAICVSRLVWVE